ncbi:L,D-transpeptidase-like protein [Dongia mobilis]|uniref:L,D-transpeptidase-like protein n=1 Tax=Dongia mobilis TaxID=578943 RepID=A0A4R6WJQ8_9PROT|nr:L,D-transpeptidase family protein [Dongia mobilis]TDQ78868.1 L,D-transpeptidase-like protein [Dongia mobilis]
MTEFALELALPAARPRRFLHRALTWSLCAALAAGAVFALAGPVTALALGPVDKVVVDKSARSLTLLRDGAAVFTADISLGKSPQGQKQREGDERTPEGKYRLIWGNPDSTHYRAILISYPSKKQAAAAAAKGEDAGGGIMIHGQRQWWRFLTRSPLTNGCIGLSNFAMDVVWNAVELGAPIEIRP